MTAAQLQEMKNKLYGYDVALKRKPLQYTDPNKLIFKGGSLLRDY
jgi:hypothetical protein